MVDNKERLVVFTDNEYLHDLMSTLQKLKKQYPTLTNKQAFEKLGGYEAIKKSNTSLVQFGGVVYNLNYKKIIKTLSINIKHDSSTAKFIPDEDTYLCAYDLTGFHFDQCNDAISLQEASKILREFIGNYPWVVMANDLNVIRHQLPNFANDRKEPILLKPLLKNTKAEGYNSGRLYQLLTPEELKETGFTDNTKNQEHTGFWDSLSMAVYCAVNKVI
jgi:hypothetical protein